MIGDISLWIAILIAATIVSYLLTKKGGIVILIAAEIIGFILSIIFG